MTTHTQVQQQAAAQTKPKLRPGQVCESMERLCECTSADRKSVERETLHYWSIIGALLEHKSVTMMGHACAWCMPLKLATASRTDEAQAAVVHTT
jgi:hypothetical protein